MSSPIQHKKEGSVEARVFEPGKFRAEFPLFAVEEHRKLAYLDNAATSQKPQVVIDALCHYYTHVNANIHRGVYRLSTDATEAYDRARRVAAEYLNAGSPQELIFVRGATEGINLVANSFLKPRLRPGDEILLTVTEHHANFVPWQLVAEATGAHIRLIPINEEQAIDGEAAADMMNEKTRMLAFVHGSNAIGNYAPSEHLIDAARDRRIPVLVDACQLAAHGPLDVEALRCDFLVFSGHKVFGPTGIGVLYGKSEHLESMVPYQGGGDMIDRVSLEGTTYARPPLRFEAGTPNIAGAVGLAAALQFMRSWDLKAMARHEASLLDHALQRLGELKGVHVYGGTPPRLPLVSFIVDGIHTHDLATFLDVDQLAVRAGHHCCQPLMQCLGIAGTTRASFAPYNTIAEVDRLIASVEKTMHFFK